MTAVVRGRETRAQHFIQTRLALGSLGAGRARRRSPDARSAQVSRPRRSAGPQVSMLGAGRALIQRFGMVFMAERFAQPAQSSQAELVPQDTRVAHSEGLATFPKKSRKMPKKTDCGKSNLIYPWLPYSGDFFGVPTSMSRFLIACAVAASAIGSSCQPAAAGPLCDWLFGKHRAPACATCAPTTAYSPPACGTCQTTCTQTCQRVVVNYVPCTAYRTDWEQVPVTHYQQTSSTDPGTFVAIGVIVSMVAIAACLVPARRAMRVDPLVALRAE